MMLRCMPVLQVADVKKSETFYCEKLGFRSHGTWGDGPDFAIVQRGRVTIALDRAQEEGPIPLNQYWAAYVYVEDADRLCDEFRKKGIEVLLLTDRVDEWVVSHMPEFEGKPLVCKGHTAAVKLSGTYKRPPQTDPDAKRRELW